jgi:hypothetical protein
MQYLQPIHCLLVTLLIFEAHALGQMQFFPYTTVRNDEDNTICVLHSCRAPSCTRYFPRRSPQHNNLTDLTTKAQPVTQPGIHSATTQPLQLA